MKQTTIINGQVKRIIEFKAFVDGKEIASTGFYSLKSVMDQLNEGMGCTIGNDLLEKVEDFYTEPAERMDRNDFHQV